MKYFGKATGGLPIFSIAVVLSGGFFLLDLAFPLGVAAGVPYVGVVMLGWWSGRRDVVALYATLSTGLIVLGFFWSPQGGIEWVVLVNRFLALSSVWTTALLLILILRGTEELRLKNEIVHKTLAGTAMVKLKDGEIVFVNPRFAQMFGYDPEEMIGKNAALLNGRDAQAAAEKTAEIAASVAETGAWMGGILNKKKDGSPFWTYSSVSVYHHPEFGAVGLGVHEDISARQESQTRAIQSQRLEAVGQLTGGIAHEFNNLLQIIMGYNALNLDSTPASDPKQKNMLAIEDASLRGAALVSQLLGFSRQQPITPERLDLNEVISVMTPLLRTNAGERISLEVNLDSALARVFADKVVIEQILLNLTINARHAMADGGTMTLKTWNAVLTEKEIPKDATARVGNFAAFSVADTGHGMTDVVLNRIFEPFFTTKGPQLGTGLGLSMVHGLVKQHGGHIKVSSKPGAGATFVIYLPVHVGHDAQRREPERATVPRQAYDATILVAEDERGVAELTVSILKEDGFTVLRALDGEEALRMFEAHHGEIDLLLLDVALPKMSGVEVSQRIRKLKPDIRVVFQTGYETKTAGTDIISGKGTPLLRKPFSPAVLRATVRDTLSPGDSAGGG